MKTTKLTLSSLIITGILFVSCSSNPKGNSSAYEQYYEEEEQLPYGVSDTINGEKVSYECAMTNFELEGLQERIEAVKSPDMLMHLKARFQHDIDSLTQIASAYTSNEQAIIASDCSRLKVAYEKACRAYEIPAEGVIANLNDCIKTVQKAKTDIELYRFINCRVGMLNNLDIIHLCVESRSTRIKEVQSLAHKLKTELYNKKKKLNIE